MSDKLVTLAIHTEEKARILTDLLESQDISVTEERVSSDVPDAPTGIRLRIKESDLSRALNVVESRNLFSYSEPETY